MPLSIDKLKDILKNHNLIPVEYFTMYDICIMIKVVNTEKGEHYILYIPSKYEFIIRDKSYEIKEIEIDRHNDFVNEFIDNPYSHDIEDTYSQIMTTIDQKNIVEESLNENYKSDIVIEDQESQHRHNIASIYRQLNRLKFCVQSIKYKLSIIYKNYICILHIDNTIECFKIRNYTKENGKQLFILIDLELFFENIDIFQNDLDLIQKNIGLILEKNHKTHSLYINKLLSKQTDIDQYLTNIIEIKTNNNEDIDLHKQKLCHLINDEYDILDKFNREYEKVMRTNNGQSTYKFTKYKMEIDEQLTNIDSKKYDVTQVIIELTKEQNNLSLLLDKLLFENTLLLNRVFDNIDKLKELANY